MLSIDKKMKSPHEERVEEDALRSLASILRPDVIYVSVSQDDEGLRSLAKLRSFLLCCYFITTFLLTY